MEDFLVPRWEDYELIDFGDGEKLERFSTVVTIRPEPLAKGRPSLSRGEWEKMAHLKFIEHSSSSGKWKVLRGEIPKDWSMHFMHNGRSFKLKLAMTAFKHVGVFPEQSLNWRYIMDSLSQCDKEGPGKFLNLFAYTGAASLAARATGASVTHVDSIRQVVTWANENQQLSQLSDIRWIVEDALKYAKREAKRGRLYQGVIMDPPAFGYGPKGERWKLETKLPELLEAVFTILDPSRHFLILNVYAHGITKDSVASLVRELYPLDGQVYVKNLMVVSSTGKLFNQGILVRIQKGYSNSKLL